VKEKAARILILGGGFAGAYKLFSQLGETLKVTVH
jgi:hypothetical protein